jgi:hypothetical protein
VALDRTQPGIKALQHVAVPNTFLGHLSFDAMRSDDDCPAFAIEWPKKCSAYADQLRGGT